MLTPYLVVTKGTRLSSTVFSRFQTNPPQLCDGS